MIGIYKITSPSGKIYIGQSRSIKKRFNSYKNVSAKNQGQPKLYNSLIKHGSENHTFEVLELCAFEELNNRERYWQDFYDACSRKNLNCELTGTDTKPRVVSEETKRKISELAKERMAIRVLDPVWMEKMRQNGLSRRGIKQRPKTDAEKEATRIRVTKEGRFKGENNPNYKNGKPGKLNPMYGKIQSKETRLKISEKAKGRLHGDSAKKLMSQQRSLGGNVKAKLVLNTEIGVYFSCGKEAWLSTDMKISFTTFRCNLNGWNKNKTPFIYV